MSIFFEYVSDFDLARQRFTTGEALLAPFNGGKLADHGTIGELALLRGGYDMRPLAPSRPKVWPVQPRCPACRR